METGGKGEVVANEKWRQRENGGKTIAPTPTRFKQDVYSNMGNSVTGSNFLWVMHGSRDPRPQARLQALAREVHHQWQAQGHPFQIHLASLEFAPEPLDQQIYQVAQQVLQQGEMGLEILPLFLLAGEHVCRDLPQAVAAARTHLPSGFSITLHPHLGSCCDLAPLLQAQGSALSFPGKSNCQTMLLAHGSGRSGAVDHLETLAARLGMVTAYWAHPPSLEERVAGAIGQGYAQIQILPYFLFEGGITDALATRVTKLQDYYCQSSETQNFQSGDMPTAHPERDRVQDGTEGDFMFSHDRICFYLGKPLAHLPQFPSWLSQVTLNLRFREDEMSSSD